MQALGDRMLGLLRGAAAGAALLDDDALAATLEGARTTAGALCAAHTGWAGCKRAGGVVLCTHGGMGGCMSAEAGVPAGCS